MGEWVGGVGYMLRWFMTYEWLLMFRESLAAVVERILAFFSKEGRAFVVLTCNMEQTCKLRVSVMISVLRGSYLSFINDFSHLSFWMLTMRCVLTRTQLPLLLLIPLYTTPRYEPRTHPLLSKLNKYFPSLPSLYFLLLLEI